MIGLLAAAAFLLTTQTQPEALGYVPSSSILVVEVRPELPGDQRQALGTILSHFPGFADQSTLGTKLDEALDQLVQRVTDGDRRYIGDLKPYLAGPLYVAIPAPPASTSVEADERGLIVLTTDGSSGLSCERLDPATPATTERHRDVDIRVRSMDDRQIGCAMSGRFVLVGDVASVKGALDTKAEGKGIASNARYTAASKAVPGDHLAWAYVDSAGLGALATSGPIPSLLPSPFPAGQVPEWMALELRATASGPVLEAVAPDPRRAAASGASPASTRTPRPDAISAIAPRLPASTIAVFEVHDLGGQITSGLSQLRNTPGTSEVVGQIDAALALVGGPDGLIGPLDQAAVAVTLDGGKANAGLVLQTVDPAAARARLDQLGTLLTLAGIPGATTEQYKGDRLLKLPIGAILGVAGGMLPGGALPGGSLPPEARDQVIVLGAHEGLLVAGLGDAFVKSVIDTPAGSSLADQSGYRAAIELAGSTNSGQAYLDVQDVIAVIVPLMSSTEAATFEREVRPYLQPIAAIAMSASSRDGLIRSRVIVGIP
jgi:hypothetical protein